ncbi:MAG: hypothetical protein FWF79_07510 [Defluviitaleaceae bacterium]|nr:hypothetical protein [Defluviitaleaceae bacterium]
MAFPFTHLIVAYRVLDMQPVRPVRPARPARPVSEKDAAMFLLGSLAPDAVHYRSEYRGANMKNIGAAKKITHLCPVSDERWGSVTDNDGWFKNVQEFLLAHPKSAFAAGYAAHVLTDITNNRTLWDTFRKSFPAEAAKGYLSDYYTDLKNIDTRLYQETTETKEIFRLLAKADASETISAWGNNEPLVTPEEIQAIQQNILHEHFKNVPEKSPENPSKPQKYYFVTFKNMLDYIQSAVEFVNDSVDI